MNESLIFFVDDEPVFINLLEYTFKCKNNYITEAFDNGEKCIEQLSLNPDLVVMDYLLDNSNKQMNGLDVARVIRKEKPHIPIIILSGCEEETVVKEFMNIGVEKFILKDGYFIDNLRESILEMLP